MSDLNVLVVVAVCCVAVAIPLLAYAFSTNTSSTRHQALGNLNRGVRSVDARGDDSARRGPVAKLAWWITPQGFVSRIDRGLSRAGRPSSWPVERVIVTKLVLGAVALVLGLLVVAGNPSLRAVLLLLLVVGFVWVIPDLILWGRAQERSKLVEEGLPDAMDQLSIAVEAGLGFEAALAHVGRHSSGPLSEEIVRTLQDIQVGRPRRQAYIDLAERTQVKDLRRFVRAINQAETNGISIGRVLSTQAREMRIKRRQRAEEKAMQIPVKVVFPLVLCILPVLFIVVLGPAVLGVMDTFL